MKKFFRCKLCGAEFCLKGRKYCEEGGDVLCSGQPPSSHEKDVPMEYAGNTIEDLRALRKKHRGESANKPTHKPFCPCLICSGPNSRPKTKR